MLQIWKHTGNVVKCLLMKKKGPSALQLSHIDCLPHSSVKKEKERKLWIQIDVLVEEWEWQPAYTSTSCFLETGSGGEPGPKEAVITGTAARKYIRAIYFTGKHGNTKAGSQRQHGVCLCFHLLHTHALNMVQQSHSPTTLKTLASHPPTEHFLGNSDQECILDDGATATAEGKITF